MDSKLLATIWSIEQINKIWGAKGLPFGLHCPRVAFLGKSNAGKSSLLNELLGGRLARISKTPGRTASLNFYHAPAFNKILVDCPGQGFARVSKEEKSRWSNLLDLYLSSDKDLIATIGIVDSRRVENLDQEVEVFGQILRQRSPLYLVLSKSDLLKNQAEKSRAEKTVRHFVSQYGGDATFVSSKTGQGIKELKQALIESKTSMLL